jgi:alkanesulfonate monooxygenase SsuD/methylene tetrahydromethanopterin reductase-like flavin-dependent oxidoreductase (luciferase family)
MTAAVSEEMIDAIALAGTPEEVRARFAERWEDVYEHTLLWPPALLGEEGVRAAVEAFQQP